MMTGDAPSVFDIFFFMFWIVMRLAFKLFVFTSVNSKSRVSFMELRGSEILDHKTDVV